MHCTHEYSMLREFAHERIKKERSVDYLMLLHTAYIAGDSEDENEFYTNIKNDKNFSMLNSGMALVYYNPYLCLEVPYFDDGTVDWYNVFKAFQNHIDNINDVPHYKKIVRVNLLTANNFIRTRKKVEPEIASYYISKQQFFETNENSSEFEIKVFEEYKSLMETINRYRKG